MTTFPRVNSAGLRGAKELAMRQLYGDRYVGPKYSRETLDKAIRALAARHRAPNETDQAHERFIAHMMPVFAAEARAVLDVAYGESTTAKPEEPK